VLRRGGTRSRGVLFGCRVKARFWRMTPATVFSGPTMSRQFLSLWHSDVLPSLADISQFPIHLSADAIQRMNAGRTIRLGGLRCACVARSHVRA